VRWCLLMTIWTLGAQDLAAPRRVSGQVVDESGAPVAGASVLYFEEFRNSFVSTNSEGRFSLETAQPNVLIHAFRYESYFLPTAGAGEKRIVLRAVRPKEIAECKNTPGRVTFLPSGRFSFPVGGDIRQARMGRDVDYLMQIYWVKGTSRQQGIRHGSGPTWSLGVASPLDVWRSVRYEESHYGGVDGYITDARGVYANGRRWRYVGAVGESASYSDASPELAGKLDRVLDGFCMGAK
jgi:hypothetical protein